MKNLIFCFDGTSNEPADAAQEMTSTGGVADNSISNILKLHLMFGGDLKDESSFDGEQLSLYYSGVGTYGSKIKQIFNAGLALKDPGRIINEALEDLDLHYESGDRLFVFGFSRGAAIARRFASVYRKDAITRHIKANITFLGVFDTVASIGMPDLDTDEDPPSDVIFENRTVSPNVKEALHLCSIDDKRKAFQPTLMNAEDRVTEVWFAGAHSDVGGGYHRDGLSDNSLRFMMDELDRRKLKIKTMSPIEVNLNEVNKDAEGKKGKYSLDYDDLIIEPNVFGKNHQQSRLWLMAKLTLYDRKIAVIKKDKIVEDNSLVPLIHHTAAERIYGDIDYRPISLKGVKHDILYDDDSVKVFNGLSHHIQVGMRSLVTLDAGESITVPVMAHQYYNRTGVLLQRGAKYSFKVKPGQVWKDGGIECNADGWKRNRQSLGWIKSLAIGSMESFKRVPDALWFTLIGAVGDSDDETFIIGTKSVQHIAKKSDEFCPFANDLKRMYGNNEGRLNLVVKRIA